VLLFQTAYSDTSITFCGLVKTYVIHNTYAERLEMDEPGSYPGEIYVSLVNKLFFFFFAFNCYNPAN